MKKLVLFFVMVIMISYGVFGSGQSQYKDEKAPDTIYTNGTIITMNDKQKFAESFAVKGDKISDIEDIKKLASNKTKIVDLKGRTVVPGFIDSHGHFYYTSEYESGWSDLNSHPIGKVKTVNGIISILKEKSKDNT